MRCKAAEGKDNNGWLTCSLPTVCIKCHWASSNHSPQLSTRDITEKNILVCSLAWEHLAMLVV